MIGARLQITRDSEGADTAGMNVAGCRMDEKASRDTEPCQDMVYSGLPVGNRPVFVRMMEDSGLGGRRPGVNGLNGYLGFHDVDQKYCPMVEATLRR